MRLPVVFGSLVLSGTIALVLARGVPSPSRNGSSRSGVAALLAGALPPLPTLRSSEGTCPLTPEEEQDAVEKFDKLWPVLRHPRCLNCHGAVNPFVEQAKGHHGGGKIEQLANARASLDKCEECHYVRNWDTPASVFLFTGKSARQLCMQFKETERDPTMFVQHLYNDRGGTPFIETAFKGDRGLNDMGQDMVTEANPGRPFQPEKPPMDHGEFVQLGSDWANAVGERGWKATKDCGCGRKVKAWTGTIRAVWDFNVDRMGHIHETNTTNIRFEYDSSFAPGADIYWKSVSGEIEWTTKISGGECRADASGLVPVGLGADLNPMGILSYQNLMGQPRRTYMVAIGPWRDQDQPKFQIYCKDAPPLWGILYGMEIWWMHPVEGMDSPDGKTLKGRYTMPLGNGTGTWEWDLQLDDGVTDAE